MIIKYIKGSILDTELRYIAHGVNCQNIMGSGVAKVLFSEYPNVKIKYHEYCNNFRDFGLLGRSQEVYVTNSKSVFNLFTQEYFGNDGKKYVDYCAIADCFRNLTEGKTLGAIAIPKIGAGLAGGDWKVIKAIINDATKDKLEVWVYEL